MIPTVEPGAFNKEHRAFEYYKNVVVDYDVIADHSVAGDEIILVRDDKSGDVCGYDIGSFVDDLLRRTPIPIIENETELAPLPQNTYSVMTVEGDSVYPHRTKITWKPIESVMRHSVDEISRLKIRGGINLGITGNHAVYTIQRTSEYDVKKHRNSGHGARKAKHLKLLAASETEGKFLAVAPILPAQENDLKTIRIPIEQLAGRNLFIESERIPEILEPISRETILNYRNNQQILLASVDRRVYEWSRSKRVPLDFLITLNAADKIEQGYITSTTHPHIKVPVQFPLLDSILMFFGLWIGDGCYDQTSAIRISEPDAHDLVRLVGTLFGANSRETAYRPDVNINVNSSALTHCMQSLGFVGHAHTKRIPPWVFGLSRRQLRIFIDGLILGDGCRDQTTSEQWKGKLIRRNRYSTVNPHLMKQVSMLIRLAGYLPCMSRYRVKERHDGLVKNPSGFMYEIAWYPESENRVRDPDLRRQRVKEIEIVKGRRYVYDLSVEGCERFLCSGVLCHNSWSKWAYTLGDYLNIVGTLHSPIQFQRPPPRELPCLSAVSQSAAQYAQKALGVPVRCIYNPVDLDMYPYDKEAIDKSFENPRYLSLNRIGPEKNIDLIVDWCHRANVGLDIVGDDRNIIQNQNYPQLVKAKVSQHNKQADETKDGLKHPKMQYYGLVDHEKKIELLKKCRAVILLPKMPPEYFEVFGLAAVEANAMGKPVIAFRNGGLSEILVEGETGFFVSNVDEFIIAIKKLETGSIKPEDCRKRAMHFSIPERSKYYLKVLESVVSGSRW